MVRPRKRVRSRTAWLPPATTASRPCAAMPNSPAASQSANGFSGGQRGARPPASLRRGRTECGHGEYAGSPALAASDNPTSASAKPFNEPRRSPADGGDGS